MGEKSIYINKINNRLAEFKKDFDLADGDLMTAETIMKYAMEISAVSAVSGGVLEIMKKWIESGGENNLEAIEALKLMGIAMPVELGYIFLIGLGDESTKIVMNIIGDTAPSLLLDIR